MSVAGVVLAAGFSRRLGRPKQLVMVAGETLVERTVRVARAAGLGPVFVVVNARAPLQAYGKLTGCVLVPHETAEEGIAASIRAGVRAAEWRSELQGLVLMTCDQIGMSRDHLQQLYAEPDRLTGSGYAGKVAVPAYFPRRYFAQLLQLQGDVGARPLLRGAYAIEGDGLAVDVDTEEDVQRAQRLFGAAG